MARQYVSSLPITEEINTRDVIIFKKDVLLIQLNQWLKKRTNPGDKWDWPIFEEVYLLESLLENEKADFDS